MSIQKATYSAEDNKLRIYYGDTRVSQEVYNRIKSAGFKWAPKQGDHGLSVAPSWSPSREDLCIELAGELQPEDTSLAERAQAKIERIQGYAENKLKFAAGYMAAAQRVSDSFDNSQPILAGHHTESKARNAERRIERSTANATEMLRRYNYWNWKEKGVAAHANNKDNPRTVANRIEGLLKDLRDLQRAQNNAESLARKWSIIDKMENDDKKDKLIRDLSGFGRHYGVSSELYYSLKKNDVCPFEAATELARRWSQHVNSISRSRWMDHTLNRLAFEQSRLGPVSKFNGELTAVILQLFIRTHGGEKPKATKSDTGWTVVCNESLPMHLGSGKEVHLSDADWCDLMQSVGYAVPVKTRRKSTASKKAALINPTRESAQKLQDIWNANISEWNRKNGNHQSEVCEMTQKEYSYRSRGSYGSCETHSILADGSRYRPSDFRNGTSPEIAFRVRISHSNTGLYAPNRVVIITDKPQKDLPL